MDSASKIASAATIQAREKSNRSKIDGSSKCSENLNPNLSSPNVKSSKSPSITKLVEKSAKKSASRNPNPNKSDSPLFKKKIRERKFVIAKKKSQNENLNCEKCKKKADGTSKCVCLAYENLRASQEEFCKNLFEINDEDDNKIQEYDNEGKIDGDLSEINGENVEMCLKRSRDRFLEEARESIPTRGQVRHLVQTFENLKLLPKSNNSEEKEADEENKVKKWALPGLQQPSKVLESQVSFSSLCPSDFFFTSDGLDLDSRRSYSLDSSRGSISTRISAGGGRSRRSSAESSETYARRRYKRKQMKRATSQKPFMLRTEQRGRSKEEEFTKKLQQMIEEEEKLRIPLAQGLPCTTDEPECLAKPPVKDLTRPIDLVLHSDVRAVDRAEFDHQVAQKMSFIEQYRMERERQQKLAEEEEIRRLRKEIVPKAQPMPYFDRPFVPKRSVKHPTVPKEPKFHVPQRKKICYSSWDNSSEYDN